MAAGLDYKDRHRLQRNDVYGKVRCPGCNFEFSVEYQTSCRIQCRCSLNFFARWNWNALGWNIEGDGLPLGAPPQSCGNFYAGSPNTLLVSKGMEKIAHALISSHPIWSDEFTPGTVMTNGPSKENFVTIPVTIPDNFYKKFTMSIGNIAKRILDPETRKLMKAGFLDSNLSLTMEGDSQLRAIVFAAHKAELLKAADEAIAETKEK